MLLMLEAEALLGYPDSIGWEKQVQKYSLAELQWLLLEALAGRTSCLA